MAIRHAQVKVVLDTGCLVEFMERVKAAADANPMSDDESPTTWVRRVIDAACWRPDGWTASPETPSPASGDAT